MFSHYGRFSFWGCFMRTKVIIFTLKVLSNGKGGGGMSGINR
jgi:hypothetical protein